LKKSLDQIAADWLARRFAGLTPDEVAEFECWRAADRRHAAAYAELEAAWCALDRVRLPETAVGNPDPDALAPRGARPIRLRLMSVLAAAAAAAVVMAGVGWSWLGSKGGGESGRLAASHTDLLITAVGEVQKLDLPDGSVVRVNTDSRVEVDYSAAERRVRLLRGEAHFAVAKNPARPFFVEASGVAVRAVGTAFNVRLRPETIEVLVTEGKVRVADLAGDESLIAPPLSPAAVAAPSLLLAGERAVIPVAVPKGATRVPVLVAPMAPAEIGRALAWQDRRIEAVAAPLAEIVAEFNRYNRAKLVVDDPELAVRRFGGSFRADDPETFVRLLETRFGLHAERREHTTMLRLIK
jgi:transmembrane sensor